jgi:L,D-transpeptidase catalytic domain
LLSKRSKGEGALPAGNADRIKSLFDTPFVCVFHLEMHTTRFLVLLPLLLLGGCAQFMQRPVYDNPAYKPKDPSKVVVKVSLSKQMVYVLEGNRPLLVTACCVGDSSHPTPKGNFCVLSKNRTKRSGEYGFDVLNNVIRACSINQVHGHYVGYPMPYWVEFTPGYGFHQGWVWPMPRSHGCIRLHANDAGKFFLLVHEGTPVRIAESQIEDATLGANHKRPQDYADPDLPNETLTAKKYFEQLKSVFLQ